MKTVPYCQSLKTKQEKIVALTAYDASFAHVFSEAGVDLLLVGDSMSSVIHGKKNSIFVTVDEIEYHTKQVSSGNQQALLMVDLPFMSYYTHELALANSARLMQAGAAMVKMEGGAWLADTIKRVITCGIPVCAHIGLMAQSVHQLGGHKVQGRDQAQAKQLYEDALVLQEAGASFIVLECIPTSLATTISQSLTIPTIGIGAGRHCDGQILVSYDMLGITPGKKYKFVTHFLNEANPTIQLATKAYVDAVKSQIFPTEEQGFQ